MSIKDLNKVIIISSSTTGRIVQTIDYEDFQEYSEAERYLNLLVRKLIDSEEGVLIKIGNKP